MSVITEQDVEYRGWGGFNDRRLPEGLWMTEGAIVGDASGGVRSVSLVFNPLGAPELSLAYSLEQIAIVDSDNVTKTGGLETAGMEPLVDNASMDIAIALSVIANGSGQALLSEGGYETVHGIFLGRVRRNVVELSGVTFRLANLLNATLTFAAQGYVWGARSWSAPDGGLLRPPRGLYA